jgi:hypothetical protein
MALSIYALRDYTYGFMQNKNIAILIPIGGVIYVAMLFLTGTISKEMLALIRKPKVAPTIVQE